MQQYRIQQAQQTSVLHDDKQQFIEELEVFKHEVEQVDSSAWGRKEVRVCKRDDLVCLSLAVLRAFNSRSC
jgi:hypothetical protein